MAAVRTMLSAAREEAAIISTELATTARTATIEVSRTAEMEMNPNVVRQAIKASVKQGSTMEETSLLASHLAHAPPVNAPLNLPAALAEVIPEARVGLADSSSTVTRALERETGVTSFQEALSNAGQTGAEEQLDEVVDIAKVLLKEPSAAQAQLSV